MYTFVVWCDVYRDGSEEQRLTTKTNSLLDANQQAYYLNFSANCWLGIRLEFAGTMIITFCALAAVLSRDMYDNSSDAKRHEFAGIEHTVTSP